MKKVSILSFLAIIMLSVSFGSCAQDETMDDLIDHTDISRPAVLDHSTSNDAPFSIR